MPSASLSEAELSKYFKGKAYFWITDLHLRRLMHPYISRRFPLHMR